VTILGVESHRPGIHSIVDPVAVRYITKNRLKLVVINGSNPSNVLKAIRGEPVGTLVS
jgi:uridylate kinase